MAGANREWLVEQFSEFTSLDSESFHEKAVAAKLKPMLEALGFDVIEDNAAELCGSECGNIYGFIITPSPNSLSGLSSTLIFF